MASLAIFPTIGSAETENPFKYGLGAASRSPGSTFHAIKSSYLNSSKPTQGKGGIACIVIPDHPSHSEEAAVPFPQRRSAYSVNSAKGLVTIMSAFRKDLFVSVTLPLLGLGALVFTVIGGSFLYTNSSYNRLDDFSRQSQTAIADHARAQAVTAEQLSNLTKSLQETNSKLDKIGDQIGTLSTSLEVFRASQGQSARPSAASL